MVTLRSKGDETPIAGDALHLLSRVLDAVHQGGVRLHGEVVAHQGKAKALIQDRLDTLGYTFFDGTGNLRKLFRIDDVRSACHEILSKIDARLDVHARFYLEVHPHPLAKGTVIRVSKKTGAVIPNEARPERRGSASFDGRSPSRSRAGSIYDGSGGRSPYARSREGSIGGSFGCSPHFCSVRMFAFDPGLNPPPPYHHHHHLHTHTQSQPCSAMLN